LGQEGCGTLISGIGLGLIALVVFIVIVIFILALIVGALLFLLPATIVAVIVWLLSGGNFLYAVIAFIIVAVLVKLARR
jgi:hypothetical protein